MEHAHALALAFDTDDPQFARGVEVGRLWEQATSDLGSFSQDLHASNAEMVLRVAEASGRAVESKDLDELWLRVTFAAKREGAP